MRSSSCRWVLVVGAVIAVACSAAPKAKSERICTPGNYVFCRCKDRSEGTKLCNEDGDGFEPCEGCLSGADGNDPDDPEPPLGDAPKRDAGKDGASPPSDAGPSTAQRPKPGELFVTEIMYDPSGPEPSEEWFEVFSIATATVSMNGLLVRDGAGRVHGVPPSPAVLLAPGKHMLFVRNRPAAIATGVPSAAILFEYGTGDPDTGGVLLTNSATGALSILDGATEVVKVAYGPFGFSQSAPGGASIQLKVPDATLAKSASGWCLSPSVWTGQPASKNPKDKGSPGAASSCP